jgi:glycosyltransferase involved in cell wall biosynthesis
VCLIDASVERRLPANPERRQWIIRNPVADEFCAMSRRHQPTGEIVVAGYVSPLKNTLTAIEAFEVIAKVAKDTTLVVAGRELHPEYSAECRAAVHDLGIENRVRFAGEMRTTELARLFGRASCLLHTSHTENAPMVVSEALVSGLPVVASDVGAVSSMLSGGGGIAVSGTAPTDFARAVLEVLQGDSAVVPVPESIRQLFMPEVVACQTAQMYREVVEAE